MMSTWRSLRFHAKSFSLYGLCLKQDQSPCEGLARLTNPMWKFFLPPAAAREKRGLGTPRQGQRPWTRLEKLAHGVN